VRIVLGAIPRIRRPRLSARVRAAVRQHRLELGRVARLVRQPLRHDYLMRGIDGRLGVYPWMNLSHAFIIRRSGSVKWRGARSRGVPGGCFAGQPRRGRSEGAGSVRALIAASASKAVCAVRIFVLSNATWPQCHHACLLTQLAYVREQSAPHREMPLPNIADCPKVWLLSCSHGHDLPLLLTGLGDPL
jgi:hypothetical protein